MDHLRRKVSSVEVRDARIFEDTERQAICSIYAVISCVVKPFGIAGIVGSPKESAAFGGSEVGGDRSSNGDLVSVLPIGADVRSIENHRDVQCFQIGSGTNSGEFQELWGVEYTTIEDDFASGKE